MKLSPYIAFEGNCEEAIGFYAKVLKTDAINIVRYKDAPASAGYNTPPEIENFVMHGQIECNGVALMFCDTPPEFPIKKGDNITLMMTFDGEGAAKDAFAALSEGGQVSMELQETFWSKCFGSVMDKYGINWHISV